LDSALPRKAGAFRRFSGIDDVEFPELSVEKLPDLEVDMPEPRRVRYAVVGLGYIAQNAILPAFRNARRNSELVALVSGDSKKLRTLGRRYGIDRRYGYENFGDCLANVDAVFIALPNHLHASYAIAAAESGVHVLCEKPLAVTEEECERMVEAARTAGVRLMTAYRLHFERGNLRALEIARSGRLGELRFYHSAFSMQVKPGNIRLDDEDRGGGPVYDLGVYCLNATRHLFDAEPEEVFAYAATNGDRRFTESEEMLSALVRFPGDRLASFTVSNGASDTGWFEIVGTKGKLRMSPAFEYAHGLELEVTVKGRTRRSKYPKRDQFAPELLHFSDCILGRAQPEPSGLEGQADVRIVQALLESAKSGRPVRLPAFEAGSGPRLEQEIRRPPIPRQDLVQAEPPHPS
jgi:predicted dehydrogenase